MAAALLRMRLESLGADAVVESAGVLEPHRRVTSGTVSVLATYGIDLRTYRSRQLSAKMVAGASMVLGLERAHVREAILLDPSAWPRAFTLKELVRRGEAIGNRRRGERLEAWLARAHAGRLRQHLLGADPADDIADPYGLPNDAYAETGAEIDDLVTRLVRLAWPKAALEDARAP